MFSPHTWRNAGVASPAASVDGRRYRGMRSGMGEEGGREKIGGCSGERLGEKGGRGGPGGVVVLWV